MTVDLGVTYYVMHKSKRHAHDRFVDDLDLVLDRL